MCFLNPFMKSQELLRSTAKTNFVQQKIQVYEKAKLYAFLKIYFKPLTSQSPIKVVNRESKKLYGRLHRRCESYS